MFVEANFQYLGDKIAYIYHAYAHGELVTRNLQILPPSSQHAPGADGPKFLNLGDPETFPRFSATALNFAVFPNSPRRTSAEILSYNTKRGART